jgi:hypothetical protein
MAAASSPHSTVVAAIVALELTDHAASTRATSPDSVCEMRCAAISGV